MAHVRRRRSETLIKSGKGESRYLEIKTALAGELRRRRAAKHLTQAEAARVLATSQSRFARMEAGDASVSADLIVIALTSLGATVRDIGRAISD